MIITSCKEDKNKIFRCVHKAAIVRHGSDQSNGSYYLYNGIDRQSHIEPNYLTTLSCKLTRTDSLHQGVSLLTTSIRTHLYTLFNAATQHLGIVTNALLLISCHYTVHTSGSYSRCTIDITSVIILPNYENTALGKTVGQG